MMNHLIAILFLMFWVVPFENPKLSARLLT